MLNYKFVCMYYHLYELLMVPHSNVSSLALLHLQLLVVWDAYLRKSSLKIRLLNTLTRTLLYKVSIPPQVSYREI